jgi:hypothetical protein
MLSSKSTAFYHKGKIELIRFFNQNPELKKKKLFREMGSAFTWFCQEPDRFILRYPFRNVPLKRKHDNKNAIK